MPRSEHPFTKWLPVLLGAAIQVGGYIATNDYLKDKINKIEPRVSALEIADSAKKEILSYLTKEVERLRGRR